MGEAGNARERCAALRPPLRGAAARPRYGAQTHHQYGNYVPMVPMHILQIPCPARILHRKPLPSSPATSAPLQPPPLSLFLLPVASRFILSTAPALSAQTRVAPTLPHVSLPDNAPCTSPSCFIPSSSACARTPVSRQPTVSSLLKLRRTPHTAWYLEPACSAGRRCCAIATCHERPRSSGMCMAPALGSGSGALCFAEAHCVLCLCAS